ncbi:MAG: 16S rRNA (cytosine(967)-C(5))-methyltransferase [Cyanobacteria bacterium P01_G01_bin.54]
MNSSPRWLAYQALWQITRQGTYTDVALDRVLQMPPSAELTSRDRAFITELVYGAVRRQRTLDALIDQLGKRPAAKQPPKLRLVLHLGLYQLRYLDQVPDSAAVNTSVELAKQLKLQRLSGVVNGLLRHYLRQSSGGQAVLELPDDPVTRLGIQYSFPDWLIAQWLQDYGRVATEQLCDWFNQAATLDLRVNPLQTTRSHLQAQLKAADVLTQSVAAVPQALRLVSSPGAIPQLPGFKEGYWLVQESSAQLVGHLLDPQPGETVIDACAAPGGKTTHLAELMQNQGTIIAGDRSRHRLQKVSANAARLGLTIIQTRLGDSTQLQPELTEGIWVDRVLLDVPCSGLGTLHRHPDIRWRQTPDTITELAQLQRQLLQQGSTWLKPGGRLVYATCTLNPQENEQIVEPFLASHPNWQIWRPPIDSVLAPFVQPEGWLKVLPHQHRMDGFFIVALYYVA